MRYVPAVSFLFFSEEMEMFRAVLHVMTNNTDVHTDHLQCWCLIGEVIGLIDVEEMPLIGVGITVLSAVQDT